MKNPWEYRIDKYLPQILQSKQWIIHAIREFKQFETNGLADNEVWENVQAYDQKTYQTGRLIGGESLYANEDSLTSLQKIVYQSITMFIVFRFTSLMNKEHEKYTNHSDQGQDDGLGNVLIHFGELIKGYEEKIKQSIKAKLIDKFKDKAIGANWESSTLEENTQDLNENYELPITENDIKENQLQTDKDLFEEIWKQAESESLSGTRKEDISENTNSCFLLSLLEKIYEFFVCLGQCLYDAVYQSTNSRYSPP